MTASPWERAMLQRVKIIGERDRAKRVGAEMPCHAQRAPGAPPLTAGQLVQRHREAAGLSRCALSRLIGANDKSIYNLEKGQYMLTVATFARIADALNLSAEDQAELLVLCGGRERST